MWLSHPKADFRVDWPPGVGNCEGRPVLPLGVGKLEGRPKMPLGVGKCD